MKPKGFIMKNYEFSKSEQVATRFLSDFFEATSNWKNFTWFHKITTSEIEEAEECLIDASKCKRIKRMVFFYGYRNTLIARVYLEGNQFTNSDGSKPTFWKVTEVHYVNNYDESRIFLWLEWTKKKIEGVLV